MVGEPLQIGTGAASAIELVKHGRGPESGPISSSRDRHNDELGLIDAEVGFPGIEDINVIQEYLLWAGSLYRRKVCLNEVFLRVERYPVYGSHTR